MADRQHPVKKALSAAFPQTIPILAGFLFLGIAYGIYMNALGFSFGYPMLTSLVVFAGSMEFVAARLLLSPFDPLNALFLTLMINARHLFYGLSMLKKYDLPGAKRFYLIYGMCDESFLINCTADIPPDVDRGWFMFFVTLLNHIYWVLGATLGGIFGSFVPFATEGLEFVMTALFVVIFLDQWIKERDHRSAVIGLGLSALCLTVFGSGGFILPSMLCILAALTFMRKSDEGKGRGAA